MQQKIRMHVHSNEGKNTVKAIPKLMKSSCVNLLRVLPTPEYKGLLANLEHVPKTRSFHGTNIEQDFHGSVKRECGAGNDNAIVIRVWPCWRR